jgi:hypothetical protein
LRRIALALSSLAACAAISAPARADMRLGLRAEVVEACAVQGLDAARLADGVLLVETLCNAAAYTVRLGAGGAALRVSAARAEGAVIELAAGGARVRQDAPGLRVIELRLDETAALSGRLQVRIDVV